MVVPRAPPASPKISEHLVWWERAQQLGLPEQRAVALLELLELLGHVLFEVDRAHLQSWVRVRVRVNPFRCSPSAPAIMVYSEALTGTPR